MPNIPILSVKLKFNHQTYVLFTAAQKKLLMGLRTGKCKLCRLTHSNKSKVNNTKIYSQFIIKASRSHPGWRADLVMLKQNNGISMGYKRVLKLVIGYT